MSLRAVNEHLPLHVQLLKILSRKTLNLIDDIKSTKKTIAVFWGYLIYAMNLDGSNKSISEIEKHKNSIFCVQPKVYAYAK